MLMQFVYKLPTSTAIGQIIWFSCIATHAPLTAIGFGVAVGTAALPDGAADGVADGPAHAEMTARPPNAAVERRNVRREMRSMAIPPRRRGASSLTIAIRGGPRRRSLACRRGT